MIVHTGEKREILPFHVNSPKDCTCQFILELNQPGHTREFTLEINRSGVTSVTLRFQEKLNLDHTCEFTQERNLICVRYVELVSPTMEL
ncbi:hypothetical protein MAR_002502 [Mya arenaria]|uniref:CUB domain-containing protein n=1 Tax=Mya arenaria TaxID=6604 RepID=A0ABY7G5Z5_MYAAR|nr:hypothetical protein MAR_002502 [Mya arenaria]